jgi:hypothetical protein
MVGIALSGAKKPNNIFDRILESSPARTALRGKGELNIVGPCAVDAQVVIDVGEPKDASVEDIFIQEQTGILLCISLPIQTVGEAYRLLGELLNLEMKRELATYCDVVYAKTFAYHGPGSVKRRLISLYLLGDED